MSDKKLDLVLKRLEEFGNVQQEMKQEQLNMKSEMNSRFDTLETKFSMLEEKVDSLDKKTDVIQEQVVKNAENIAVMQVDIDGMKDVQESILAVQVRQEKTIDLLSRRSIDQEAELRTIK